MFRYSFEVYNFPQCRTNFAVAINSSEFLLYTSFTLIHFGLNSIFYIRFGYLLEKAIDMVEDFVES